MSGRRDHQDARTADRRVLCRNGIDPRNGVIPPGFRPEPSRIVLPAGVEPPPGYESLLEDRDT